MLLVCEVHVYCLTSEPLNAFSKQSQPRRIEIQSLCNRACQTKRYAKALQFKIATV